jgi:hypothetical protein
MVETLRTADLALATYLKIEGCPIDRLEVMPGGSPKAVAEFVVSCPNGATAESLWALAKDYERGAARVEPRDFAVEYRRVRDQLFAFLRDHRNSKGIIRHKKL